jgi:hydroxymethylglutaryl-CoA lyase
MQMAGTAEVIQRMTRLPNVHYPVLVPNSKGLSNLLAILSDTQDTPPPTDEIAIFAAATDSFSRANTNCSVRESLERLEPVARTARDAGLGVRGYVSVVVTCPYEGRVDYKRVRDVTKALIEMGCYEVSLGDTTGTGTPETILDMLSVVTSTSANPVKKLAVSAFFCLGS